MRFISKLVAFVALAAGFSGAVFAQQPNLTAKLFSAKGYYLVKQDLRKCASPRCGGVFIAPVNKRSMRCPDGSIAQECYIGTADYSALGFNPFSAARKSSFDTELLLKAKVKPGAVVGGVDVKTLVVTAARENVGKNSSVGRFWGLKDAGIRCITSPCLSGVALRLNSDFKRSFSAYDLSRAGLSKRDIETANNLIASGDVLVTKAIRRTYNGFAGRGTRFVATEVYLPVEAPKVVKNSYQY